MRSPHPMIPFPWELAFEADLKSVSRALSSREMQKDKAPTQACSAPCELARGPRSSHRLSIVAAAHVPRSPAASTLSRTCSPVHIPCLSTPTST